MKALALVWLAAVASVGTAQQPATDALVQPQPELLTPVDNEATRAMAEHVREQADAAGQLRLAGKLDEARAVVRAALDEALAAPGRDKSDALNRAIDQLSREAIQAHDEETVIRALEPCLAYRIAAQGPDNLEVQAVRGNLANSYWYSGEFERSYVLLRDALDVLSRVLAPDDPRVCDAKSNLAVVLYKRGDFEGSYQRMSEVVATLRKTHAQDDPSIQWAYANLANTLDALGDNDGALAYREQVHATLTAVLPPDDVDLIAARENLAIALRRNGDPAGARLLLQSALELELRHFPEGHRSVESTRANLALALEDLGDFHSARILLEGVLARLEARVPESDQDLNRTRHNLAATLTHLGEHERARELDERVLAIRRDTLGPEHPLTLVSLSSLALDLEVLGQLDTALEFEQQVADVLRQRGEEASEDLLRVEGNMTHTLARLGRQDEAIEAARAVAADWVRRAGAEHPKALVAKTMLAGLIEDRDREGSLALLREVATAMIHKLAAAGDALSPREAELYAADYADLIAPVLARCKSDADAATCFELVEAARTAPLASARSLRVHDRAAAADGNVLRLRDDLRRKSARVAALAYEGSRAEYQTAALERAALEQQLERAESHYGRPQQATLRGAELAKYLAPLAAAVSYRRYEPPPDDAISLAPQPARFVALVLRHDGSITRVELGAAQAIENAIDAWRRALGVGTGTTANAETAHAAGEALRALVLDPVLARAGEAKQLIVALDDVLNLAPWDALPRGNDVVGDALTIDVRASLSELATTPARFDGAHDLVVFGGIDFDHESAAKPATPADEPAPHPPRPIAMRSASERMTPLSQRFAPLEASLAEAREIAALFKSHASEGATATVFDGSAASKAALIESAGRARFLHIATHGFFAPDDVALLGEDVDKAAFSKEVFGLSPRVLCGLAFAGANRPLDFVDRGRGTLTAEELAYLDLDGCELAVLSACDTSAGLRRAGLGIASLQSALHAAGARTTLTSLWQVSDSATRELMLAFYRGIWVDGLSASQALWRAKKTLRDRRAPVRDWAGWVLTGG